MTARRAPPPPRASPRHCRRARPSAGRVRVRRAAAPPAERGLTGGMGRTVAPAADGGRGWLQGGGGGASGGLGFAGAGGGKKPPTEELGGALGGDGLVVALASACARAASAPSSAARSGA